MTSISFEAAALALVWFAAMVIVARVTSRSSIGSVGLPLGFMLSTFFFYCGFLSYVVPEYSHMRSGGMLYLQLYNFTEETVLLGVMATVVGMVGFCIGTWLMDVGSPARPGNHRRAWIQVDPVVRKNLLVVLGSYGALSFVAGRLNLELPMLDAFLRAGQSTAVAVICLGAALAVFTDRETSYVRWIAIAAAIPVAYLLLYSSVSLGFIFLMVAASFWLTVLASPKTSAVKIGVYGATGYYAALCLFVSWMSFRGELRKQSFDSADRQAGALIDGFSRIEWLTPSNFFALDLLNMRLNQYIFVGKAVEFHEVYPHLKLWGESLLLAPLAIIPRALWPGKPEMGGSSFVATHTGMVFREGVTFGGGPVLEFYANFGWIGVLLGFLLLGLIVRWIDRAASVALRDGRMIDFVRLFATGMAFIAPLTDFFFLFNTALFTWIALSLIRVAMGPMLVAARPHLTLHERQRDRLGVR